MDVKKLESIPIITKAAVKKMIGCNDSYAYTVLERLKKRGKIKEIIKSKYTTRDDIYVIATNIFPPCYLSLLSCSHYKGYTEQIINTMQICTTKRHKTISYENYDIEFIKLSKKKYFGYKKIKHGEEFIFVADDEKLIIDALEHEKEMGNIDEIIKIVQNSAIDEIKMAKYLNLINSRLLNKRAGFLLERYRKIDLSKKIRHKDRNYAKLSIYTGAKKTDKKWMVKHDL